MKLSRFGILLAVAVFATATAANAAVHRVDENDDVQALIDSPAVAPGDTILFEPGEYTGSNPDFGLRISKNNLRLIGKVKKGQGEAGKVRLIQDGDQETGVYAAPAACGPEVPTGGCPDELQGFYIRGFTVEDFPRNGIQTRFVNDFQIIRNESARNLHNGIYPTISANGLVQDNLSYGSEDTAMWVAASQNVRVIGNEMRDSVIGLEVNVSLNVEVKQNEIHNNTVGIGLFHQNSAGNLPLPVVGNWVVENNHVYDNNTPNFAPPLDFQAGLPQGVGILVLGVSDTVVAKNRVEGNEFVGIGVLGWCTALFSNPLRNCLIPGQEPEVDPSVSGNLVAQNQVSGNGLNPPMDPPFDAIDFLAADLTYFSFWPDFIDEDNPETSSGNCFEKNKPAGFTVSSYNAPPDFPFFGVNGPLPDDGC